MSHSQPLKAAMLAGFLALLLLMLSSPGGAQPEGLPGDAPDLVINEITISPEVPKPGETVNITLTIANRGEADVDDRFDVEFLISFGPPELSNIGLGILTGIRIDKRTVTTSIPSGASSTVTFRWEVLQLPQFRFIFKVDSPFDRIRESDEGNNQAEQLLKIPEPSLDQWWLDAINARNAWETSRGSEEITVAVIDTGVDQEHPEFEGSLWANPEDGSHGWDFIDGDSGPPRRTPIDFHGTSVAGLIAAREDGTGVTGVAPQVNIMDLRVFPTVRRGGRALATGAAFEDINAAIEFAVAHGADVINLSLGTSFCDVEQLPRRSRDEVQRIVDEQRSLIDSAVSQGVVVISSAGNNGRCVTFPARFESVIAVSATTMSNESPGFSSRGPEVLVGAPGGSLSFEDLVEAFQTDFEEIVPVLNSLLITPYLRENYGWFSGTSASTPLVSGVVGLMLSVDPDLTPQQVHDVLAATARDLGETGRDAAFGFGLVDAATAIECVANGLDCL